MAKEYCIWLDGKKIPVSEEVYYAYKRPAWREFKRAKVRADNERSLDAFLVEGYVIPSEQAPVDEIVADKLLISELYAALEELTNDERSLINALFFEERSERELAKATGIPRKTIAYRRNKVLEKLRGFIEKA